MPMARCGSKSDAVSDLCDCRLQRVRSQGARDTKCRVRSIQTTQKIRASAKLGSSSTHAPPRLEPLDSLNDSTRANEQHLADKSWPSRSAGTLRKAAVISASRISRNDPGSDPCYQLVRKYCFGRSDELLRPEKAAVIPIDELNADDDPPVRAANGAFEHIRDACTRARYPQAPCAVPQHQSSYVGLAPSGLGVALVR